MRSRRHLPSGSKDRGSFKMVFDGILECFTESVNFFFIGYFFFKILLIDISHRSREAHEASVSSKYAARRTISSRLHFRPIRTAVQKLFQKYTHVYSIFAPPHIIKDSLFHLSICDYYLLTVVFLHSPIRLFACP